MQNTFGTLKVLIEGNLGSLGIYNSKIVGQEAANLGSFHIRNLSMTRITIVTPTSVQ